MRGPRRRARDHDHGREQKSPQTRQSHDGKDSIRVTSNPLWRGAASATLDLVVKPLLAAIAVLASLAVAGARLGAAAGLASITFRDGALGASGSADARELAGPVRSRRAPLARHRHRAVQRSLDERARGAPWLDAAAEEDDQPDAGLAEGRARPQAGGSATRPGSGRRTGSATASAGAVRDLRAVVRPQPRAEDPAAHGRRRRLAADRAAQRVGRRRVDPPRRARPTRPPIRFASVHHTAGPNDYSPAQAAAIMRGIELYHVKSNGWNDIGYNFLVDRYGTVYEGRYGGIEQNVIGAHARGFNTGSVGVARDRDLRHGRRSRRQPRQSLEKLLAWRLDLAHVDPALDAHVRLGRAASGTSPASRSSCGRLRAPRHGSDLVPRRRPLREARRDRREDAGDRAAEALRAEGDGEPRRARALPGARFGRAPLEGRRHRRTRAAARVGVGAGADRRLDSWDASLVTGAGRPLADRGRRRDAGVTGTLGKARSSSGRSRSRPSPRRPGHDQPERRRRGRHDHDHVHDVERPQP